MYVVCEEFYFFYLFSNYEIEIIEIMRFSIHGAKQPRLSIDIVSNTPNQTSLTLHGPYMDPTSTLHSNFFDRGTTK